MTSLVTLQTCSNLSELNLPSLIVNTNIELFLYWKLYVVIPVTWPEKFDFSIYTSYAHGVFGNPITRSQFLNGEI